MRYTPHQCGFLPEASPLATMNQSLDVAALLRQLEDPQVPTESRADAAWMLRHLGDERAVPALLDRASDENEALNVRCMAIAALRSLRAVKAIPPLREIVERLDTDHRLLSFSVAALGVLGDQASFPTILVLIDHANAQVRRITAFALGELRDQRAVAVLLERLQTDVSGSVQADAADALGKIGDAQAAAPLIEALGSRFEFVRAAAARALGAIPDPRSVEPLLARLIDPAEEEYIAYKAVVALGQIGDARAISALEWVRDHRVAEYSFEPDVFYHAAAEAIANIRNHSINQDPTSDL